MKPPTVFLGEMTNPEVEAFLRDHQTVIVPTGSTEQHGPHGPLLTDVARPAGGGPPRRAARSARSSRRRSTTRLSYPHVGLHRASSTSGSRRSWRSSRTCAPRSRRSASGGSSSSTATTTTPTRSPTPARTRPTDCRPGTRAFPINYWDGMTADEAAEYFGPSTGLHANRAETSAVLAIDPALVDLDARQRGDAAVPRGHEPGAGPHRLLLLGAGFGPPRDAVGDLGRRPRVDRPSTASATSRS